MPQRNRNLAALATIAAALAAMCAMKAAAQADPNSAPNPYRTVENWAKLPNGRAWGQVISADIDRDGKLSRQELARMPPPAALLGPDPFFNPANRTSLRTDKGGVTRSDLFIMFKLDPKTPQTDNGWVYGTVSADAKNVTSAGRVKSCMDCHTEAKHDRLFGLFSRAGQRLARRRSRRGRQVDREPARRT